MNHYGSVVLFDEWGWPWPKHECPNYTLSLSTSPGRYRSWLESAPLHFLKLLERIAEDVQDKGGQSSYASTTHIPTAVLSGYYDRRQTTLEFLPAIVRDNRLKRGLFYPQHCRLCGTPVVLHVPLSGDMMLTERHGERYRLHHCRSGYSSRRSFINAAIKSSVTWRELEHDLRCRPTQPEWTQGPLIGYVSHPGTDDVVIRELDAEGGARLRETTKHPIYTLVCVLPDPFDAGRYIIRAPTIEQFMGGLPDSLPPIVREEDLTKFSLSKKTVHTPRTGYPASFANPKLLELFQDIVGERLKLLERQNWQMMVKNANWHVDRRIDPDKAAEVSKYLENVLIYYKRGKKKLAKQELHQARPIAHEIAKIIKPFLSDR